MVYVVQGLMLPVLGCCQARKPTPVACYTACSCLLLLLLVVVVLLLGLGLLLVVLLLCCYLL
jgi:hypothetical protein